MVCFNQILHTYSCQQWLTTDMRNSFLMDSAKPTGRGGLVEILITLVPHGIF